MNYRRSSRSCTQSGKRTRMSSDPTHIYPRPVFPMFYRTACTHASKIRALRAKAAHPTNKFDGFVRALGMPGGACLSKARLAKTPAARTTSIDRIAYRNDKLLAALGRTLQRLKCLPLSLSRRRLDRQRASFRGQHASATQLCVV